MQLVATEEEWLRIIRLWCPEFKVTHNDGSSVVIEINIWAVGNSLTAYDTLEEAFGWAIKHYSSLAWKVCKQVEDERSKNK